MIKDLGNEMSKFIEDLKENIKDKYELRYLLERSEKLFNTVFKEIEEIVDYKEDQIDNIKAKQNEYDKKMQLLEERIKNIYKDVYEDEYEDFEIICPYCNYEFDTNVDEHITEIACPECNNIIELDWDEENE